MESINTLMEAFEHLEMDFEERKAKLQDKIFNEIIVPFCKKHRWKFNAGMGTWFFKNKRGDLLSEIEDGLPEEIVKLLDQCEMSFSSYEYPKKKKG